MIVKIFIVKVSGLNLIKFYLKSTKSAPSLDIRSGQRRLTKTALISYYTVVLITVFY